MIDFVLNVLSIAAVLFVSAVLLMVLIVIFSVILDAFE